MLGAKCGFGPSADCVAQTSDRRFAQKSADSADNPRMARTLAQTLNVKIAAVRLQITPTRIGEHDLSLPFSLVAVIKVCSVTHTP